MINLYTEVNHVTLGMEELEVLKFATGFLKDYRPDHLDLKQAVGKADVMYTVTVDSRAKGTGDLYRHIIVIKHNGRDLLLDEVGAFRKFYHKETGQVFYRSKEAAQ